MDRIAWPAPARVCPPGTVPSPVCRWRARSYGSARRTLPTSTDVLGDTEVAVGRCVGLSHESVSVQDTGAEVAPGDIWRRACTSPVGSRVRRVRWCLSVVDQPSTATRAYAWKRLNSAQPPHIANVRRLVRGGDGLPPANGDGALRASQRDGERMRRERDHPIRTVRRAPQNIRFGRSQPCGRHARGGGDGAERPDMARSARRGYGDPAVAEG